MSNIESTPRTHVSPGTVLGRAALPLALFAAVLLFLLLLSWYLLLPRLTAVEIEGEVRSASDLLSYHRTLTARISEQETHRDQLIVPLEGTLFADIARAERQQFPFAALQSILEETATDINADGETSVFIYRYHYQPAEQILEMSGDVRNVGPRSMTVLAQFLEDVRSLPIVAEIESPRFTREEDPEIGFHSPFTFILHLQ